MLTRREWTKIVASTGLASCSQPEKSNLPDEHMPPLSSEDILDRSIVLDFHCDTPMRLVEEKLDLSQLHTTGELDIPRMRQGGITGVFFSIYTGATNKTPLEAVKKALEIIDVVIEEVHRHPKDLILATSSGEIADAKQAGKIAILMGVEGGHMIDSSLSVLRNFYRLGVRYLTLTHSVSTGWADSSGGLNGLTDFGKDVVLEMNRLGMMVDISHVSDKTFFDTIQTSKAPIIASHSSCRALASHNRNMTDEMLQALAANGGVVHINYYNAFLDDEYTHRANTLADLDRKHAEISSRFSGNKKRLALETHRINYERVEHIGRVPFSRLLDHFEHATEVAGIDHVGMGSDFDGVQGQLPEGMEDISKIGNLVEGLSERGFANNDLKKILGGNSLRVMHHVETHQHA
jgi:membrane dipeptidase